MNTEEEHLRAQINQLRETITAIENKNNGRTGMRPEELWSMLSMDDTPLHPRIMGMVRGHMNVQSLKTGLARLENDLDDLHADTLNHAPKHEFQETEDTENQNFGHYERTDE
ncbi:hypothetical protein EGH22_00165 [Halomicroarcula sp. F28]|uniref:hypothetical protein n=1 Tax=Haloarcula salinisoli TaxID=2487746 RepID=UPI001C72D13B|nr:hypothetical protein [Halomicroarcula salinisoli]MBX0284730.1 hypothetical protein [Halomicroarcula salinisoli]